jgi:AcrR family transcriptional regulator
MAFPALPDDDPAPPMLPRGRRALPREDYLAIQRSRLIAAMKESAATRGYAATSLSELTRLAGVSKGTFYEVFPAKEDCFLAALQSSIRGARAAALEGHRSSADWIERLRAGLGALLAFAAAQPSDTRMYVLETAAAGPRAIELRDQTLAMFAGLLGAGLEAEPGRAEVQAEAKAEAEIDEHSERALVGAIHQVIARHVLSGEIERLPELRDELLYAALVLRMAPMQAARASGLIPDEQPEAS